MFCLSIYKRFSGFIVMTFSLKLLLATTSRMSTCLKSDGRSLQQSKQQHQEVSTLIFKFVI